MPEIYKQVMVQKFKLYMIPVYIYIPLAYCTILFGIYTHTLFAHYDYIAKCITIIPMSLLLTRAHKSFNNEVYDEYVRQEVDVKNLKRELYLVSLIQSIIASSLLYLFVS